MLMSTHCTKIKDEMTDYGEEQKNELETLHCIYTDEELTEISEAPLSFQVRINSSDDTSLMSLDVQFTYPPTYPDVTPEISIPLYTGMSEQQVEELKTYLHELAAENLGMVMVFTLLSGVQDKLSEFLDALQQEKEREAKVKEEEFKRLEEAKFFGTTVTKETFMEWRRNFDEEMRLTMHKNRYENPTGLTGRQMFEKDSSLALSDARFLTEASELADIESQDNVEVDESLFQDLDDLQI